MYQNALRLLSVLEGLYVIYMFCFFKTTHSFEIGRWDWKEISTSLKSNTKSKSIFSSLIDLIYHPTTASNIPESQICLFGKYASIAILIYFILRHCIDSLKQYNIYIILLIFICCFSNYNAVIYMIPIILIELYLYFTKQDFK
jgi:hypothetical protein